MKEHVYYLYCPLMLLKVTSDFDNYHDRCPTLSYSLPAWRECASLVIGYWKYWTVDWVVVALCGRAGSNCALMRFSILSHLVLATASHRQISFGTVKKEHTSSNDFSEDTNHQNINTNVSLIQRFNILANFNELS